MQLSLTVVRTGQGRFEGSVQDPGTGVSVLFSGTLELLHVLEELLDDDPPPPDGPGGSGTDLPPSISCDQATSEVTS